MIYHSSNKRGHMWILRWNSMFSSGTYKSICQAQRVSCKMIDIRSLVLRFAFTREASYYSQRQCRDSLMVKAPTINGGWVHLWVGYLYHSLQNIWKATEEGAGRASWIEDGQCATKYSFGTPHSKMKQDERNQLHLTWLCRVTRAVEPNFGWMSAVGQQETELFMPSSVSQHND